MCRAAPVRAARWDRDRLKGASKGARQQKGTAGNFKASSSVEFSNGEVMNFMVFVLNHSYSQLESKELV